MPAPGPAHRAAPSSSRTLRKAISFALVGVVNTAIDAGVFFIVFGILDASASARGLAASLAGIYGSGSGGTLLLVCANVLAWLVAVSCSYVMNSFITFAAESGGKLRARDYLRFLASGVAGVVANTATLVVAAHFAPVWAAKALAIAVSFGVNFSLSHFVVFRAAETKRQSPG